MPPKEEFLLYRSILSTEDWRNENSFILPNIKSWLFEKGSLTKKLQGICQHLDIEVISQSWINEENEQKSTALFQSSWLREVILKGNGENWIFAQTYFSHSIMEKYEKDITELGERPIGLWIFPKKPTRINLEWYQDPKTSLYARRSLLFLNGDYMEVRELFLDRFQFI